MLGGMFYLLGIGRPPLYGIRPDPMTMVGMASVASLGAGAYWIFYKLGACAGLGRWVRMSVGWSARRFSWVIAAFLLLDWWVRYEQIRLGIYFYWMADSTSQEYLFKTTSLWAHVQALVGYVVLGMLGAAMLRLTGRRRLLIGLILVAQIILIIASGLRRDILYSVAVLGLAYVIANPRPISWRRVWLVFVLVPALAIFVGPAVQKARYRMREEAARLRREPVMIPVKFLADYLWRPGASDPLDPEVRLESRLQSSAVYGASIMQARMGRVRRVWGVDFWDDLHEFVGATLSLVPRVLFPGKPEIDADARVWDKFLPAGKGIDAAGTVVADAYSYL
ncbi:hypothetical protein D6833_14125, partial [Candidatus Parcubacteria bacterium]